MYPDNTLTPKEAIRLCALGTLALGTLNYGGLANAIRHFIGRVLGPSLDLMGTSVELLKYEGLIAAVGGANTDDVSVEDDAELAITDAGRQELHTLLTANLRASASELNHLIVALKFRFLHLLSLAEQQAQAEMLIEVSANELARLEDLHGHHADDAGYLVKWLDHDIAQLEERLAWLEAFRADLAPGA